jgi:hypothetical protein
MEFAAAALTTIAGGISSAASAVGGALGIGGTAAGAAGTAAGAASTAGGLFSSGSLFSTILQGGATVASVLGAVGAGNEQSRTLMAQAADARTEQDIEAIRGNERRDSLRRSLLQTLGERDVAAAASGVDLSFGTPAIARQEAQRDAESALTMDKSTEDFRVARLEERANEFTRSAKAARRGGLIRAIGAGVTTAASIGRRG